MLKKKRKFYAKDSYIGRFGLSILYTHYAWQPCISMASVYLGIKCNMYVSPWVQLQNTGSLTFTQLFNCRITREGYTLLNKLRNMVIYGLLTKHARSRWLDIDLVLFAYLWTYVSWGFQKTGNIFL